MTQSKRAKKFAQKGHLSKTIKKRHTHKNVENARTNKKRKIHEDKEDRALANGGSKQMVSNGSAKGAVKEGSFAKEKKAIEEMNVDEFLSGGFLDDASGESEVDSGDELDEDGSMEESEREEEDEADEEVAMSDNDDSGDEAGFTEADLETLKKNDPDFYSFLQKQDKDLLEFHDDEFDDAEVEDGDGADSDDGADEKKAMKELSGDMGSDDEEETRKVPVLTGKILTQLMNDAINKHSVKALRKLLLAFKEGCASADNATDNTKSNRDPKFRILNHGIFNKLMTTCISTLSKVFAFHLPKQSGPLPSSSPQWKNMMVPVKSFVLDFVHFLTNSVDKTMILYILNAMEAYIPYAASLQVKHTRQLFKVLLTLWSTNEDHKVKIVAFLRIRQMALTCPFPFIELAMKGVYLTYVKNAKFVSEASLPSIILMRNCVVELYSIDAASAYQHAFVYIRQLAIQLRTALTSKTQEAYKSVYNWQYLNCLRMWSQLLSSNIGEAALQPLLYPLVQVIVGTTKLIPTARYFPLRLHCVEMLIQLGESSSTFIPVAPLLLLVFHAHELTVKNLTMKGKPPVLPLTIKYAKTQLNNKAILEGLVSRALQLLSSFFEVYEHSIAFPELIIPTCVQLRHFAKNTSVPHWRNAAKALITKVESRASVVVQKRSSVDFAPKDVDRMATFMAKESEEVKKMRLEKSLTATIKKQYNEAIDVATAAAKNAKVGDGAEEAEEEVDEDDEGDDSEGEEEEEEDGSVEDNGDVIEDLELSDEEEEGEEEDEE